MLSHLHRIRDAVTNRKQQSIKWRLFRPTKLTESRMNVFLRCRIRSEVISLRHTCTYVCIYLAIADWIWYSAGDELVSLTWLLWALRSFRRFTLHALQPPCMRKSIYACIHIFLVFLFAPPSAS